jgi:hypothetical protein
MGKQINFYMEENTYKQIVEKALSMGFVVLYQECVGGKPKHWEYEYHWYETMPDFPFDKGHYFHNPALGGFRNTLDNKEYLTWEEIKERKLLLGCMFAPMIEARCSYVSHENKIIGSTRLYISSDYYDYQGTLVKQNEAFVKQYDSLVRIVKKLAIKREFPCAPPYADCVRKEYMTDYMLGLFKNGYEI